jgi:hypothetical protein
MVARTKQRGISWEKIGAILGMNKDTARKKSSFDRPGSGAQHAGDAFPHTRGVVLVLCHRT